MILRDSLNINFFEFNPSDFRISKINNEDISYNGKLFKIGLDRYVLWFDDSELILQSSKFKIKIKDFQFKYFETKIFAHLEISNNNKIYKIKTLKSIWEWFTLSTYDYLEKIEDNQLYYLFDTIKEYKISDENKQLEKFINNF